MKTPLMTILLLAGSVWFGGCDDSSNTSTQGQGLPEVSNESMEFAESITSSKTLLALSQGIGFASPTGSVSKSYRQQEKNIQKTVYSV